MLLIFSLLGMTTAVNIYNEVIDFDSITFFSSRTSSGKFKLVHGEYRESIVPNSAAELVVKLTEQRAIGVVNGAQTAGVVLETDLGGSGTFYDFALLFKGPEGWKHVDTAFLGDRVNIQSIELQGNEMIIEMTTHGPQDALCCPTLRVVNRFAVGTGRLVAVNPTTADDEGAGIVGPVWEWEGTVYSDGKRVDPPDPKNYTIQWLKDGTLLIKADCNSKGGSYSLKGDSLTVIITLSTLAACPEGSMEDRFVHDLTNGAARVVTRSDTLSLDLIFEAWTTTFSRKKGP